MSITVSNCNQICNSPTNSSKSKMLYTFQKQSRFPKKIRILYSSSHIDVIKYTTCPMKLAISTASSIIAEALPQVMAISTILPRSTSCINVVSLNHHHPMPIKLHPISIRAKTMDLCRRELVLGEEGRIWLPLALFCSRIKIKTQALAIIK